MGYLLFLHYSGQVLFAGRRERTLTNANDRLKAAALVVQASAHPANSVELGGAESGCLVSKFSIASAEI